eukprot:3453261-Rhodomonas_salina.2
MGAKQRLMPDDEARAFERTGKQARIDLERCNRRRTSRHATVSAGCDLESRLRAFFCSPPVAVP